LEGDLLAAGFSGSLFEALEAESRGGGEAEFVVADAVGLAIGGIRAGLNFACLGIDFEDADRFEQIRETMAEGVGFFAEFVRGMGPTVGGSESQFLDEAAELIGEEDVGGEVEG